MRQILPHRRPLFPPAREIRIDSAGLVGIGGDLSPDSLLEAYRKGVFPWDHHKPYPWFSPDPRLVLPPAEVHVAKNLSKLLRRRWFHVRYDTDFHAVLDGCASNLVRGPETWITPTTHRVWGKLHQLKVAHSIEAWRGGALVGGLYGIAVGRLFFGESMFVREANASKVAFVDLCGRLAGAGYVLIDCQADSAHLRSLGARYMPRMDYLDVLDAHWDAPDLWPAAMAYGD